MFDGIHRKIMWDFEAPGWHPNHTEIARKFFIDTLPRDYLKDLKERVSWILALLIQSRWNDETWPYCNFTPHEKAINQLLFIEPADRNIVIKIVKLYFELHAKHYPDTIFEMFLNRFSYQYPKLTQ